MNNMKNKLYIFFLLLLFGSAIHAAMQELTQSATQRLPIEEKKAAAATAATTGPELLPAQSASASASNTNDAATEEMWKILRDASRDTNKDPQSVNKYADALEKLLATEKVNVEKTRNHWPPLLYI